MCCGLILPCSSPPTPGRASNGPRHLRPESARRRSGGTPGREPHGPGAPRGDWRQTPGPRRIVLDVALGGVRRPGGRFEFLLDGFHLAPELLVGGQGFLEGPTRELAQLDGGHDAYGQSTEGLKVLLPPRLGPGVLRGAGRRRQRRKQDLDPFRKMLGQFCEDDPLDSPPPNAEVVRADGHFYRSGAAAERTLTERNGPSDNRALRSR